MAPKPEQERSSSASILEKRGLPPFSSGELEAGRGICLRLLRAAQEALLQAPRAREAGGAEAQSDWISAEGYLGAGPPLSATWVQQRALLTDGTRLRAARKQDEQASLLTVTVCHHRLTTSARNGGYPATV